MKTFFEFFAGGGMVNAGLGTDWQCTFANDFCHKKAASYTDNWGSTHLKIGDIADITPSELPGEADLAWASFPCQDLSLAGNGVGLKGERSGTFWAFWQLIKALNRQGRKPNIIALENVYGTLTSHAGKDFDTIVKAVANEGYRLGAMIIDAVHFVPQSRPRLFIVAVNSQLKLADHISADTPNPAWHPTAIIQAYNRLPYNLKDNWIWWNPPKPTEKLKTLDELVEREPVGVTWHSSEETNRLLEMMTSLNRQKVIMAQQLGGLKVGTIYRRTRDGIQRAEVRFDGISGCLRTPSGGSSRQTIIVVEGSNIRTRLLSPREAARLMGLSDSYILPSRYNDAYRLAGDGVVVPVVSHLTKHLFDPIAAGARQMSKNKNKAAA